MSIFIGQTGLRQQYAEKSAADIEATTAGDKTSAILLATMKQATRWIYLDNAVNVDVMFWIVSPKSPENTGDYRNFWFELGADRVINFGASNAPAWEIPAKSRIYIAKSSGTASAGKMRLTAWG